MCVDNPKIGGIGAVAGDEECYEMFREFFEPVVKHCQDVAVLGSLHPASDLPSAFRSSQLDRSGKYVISVRIQGSRNLSKFRFPPACSRSDRCQVESVLTNAFACFQGSEVVGEYFPLPGSSTYAKKPEGMTPEDFERLDKHHLVFYEPSSPATLSSGMGRHWPDARGLFAAASHRLIAWCNEEDHLCLSSLQPGGDIAAAFSRFAVSMRALEEKLCSQGHGFARSANLGYLTTCPGLLGTGLKVSVLLKIPLTAERPGFQDMCGNFGLRAHWDGPASKGVCNIVNISTFGRSEVDLVKAVITGCQQLVNMELALEQSVTPAADTLAGALKDKLRAAFAASTKGQEPESILVPPQKIEGLMRSISAGLSAKELELVLQSLPKSSDGRIPLDAFLTWLCGSM